MIAQENSVTEGVMPSDAGANALVQTQLLKPLCKLSKPSVAWMLEKEQPLSGLQTLYLHECLLNENVLSLFGCHYQSCAALMILELTLGFCCCNSTDFSGMISAPWETEKGPGLTIFKVAFHSSY